MKMQGLPKQLAIFSGALAGAASLFVLIVARESASLISLLVLAGLIGGVVGLSVDIFAQHRLRSLELLNAADEPGGSGKVVTVDLKMQSAEAERLAQTYFLASMSHEFRTPLAGMEASVELLQENLRSLSPEETQQLLNSVQLSLSMLHQLIDNLLESSKLEASHFVLNRRVTEVDALLGEAIRLIEPMIARRQQRLTLDEPLEMPTLQADPTRSIQMIVNLLSNASKYSPVGSVIEITVAEAQGYLRVSIADRGRGVTPEKQSSLFLPFIRLEPEAHQEHGSGLGLSVVKAIAEAHQGQVGIEARVGGGSIFWFTLPLMESKS